MAEQVTLITVLLATALACALLIERAIEVLKSGYDLIDGKFDFAKFWTRRTYGTRNYMERRLRVFEYVDPKLSASLFNRFNDMLLGPDSGYQGTVPMLSGDLVRAVWIKIACKLVGVALGLWIALYLRLDLIEAGRVASYTNITPTTKGMLLTGVAIGLGSGPVHKLIRVVEKKRAARMPEVVTNA